MSACLLSQSELAEEAGVPLRQIQMFGQLRDISKSAAETLLRISKSLCFRIEDMMEY